MILGISVRYLIDFLDARGTYFFFKKAIKRAFIFTLKWCMSILVRAQKRAATATLEGNKNRRKDKMQTQFTNWKQSVIFYWCWIGFPTKIVWSWLRYWTRHRNAEHMQAHRILRWWRTATRQRTGSRARNNIWNDANIVRLILSHNVTLVMSFARLAGDCPAISQVGVSNGSPSYRWADSEMGERWLGVDSGDDGPYLAVWGSSVIRDNGPKVQIQQFCVRANDEVSECGAFQPDEERDRSTRVIADG